MDNYKVTVGDQVMDYNSEDVAALNSIPKKNQTFHVLREHESYEVEVIATDYLNKKFTIAVNGNSYEVGLEDAYDQMVQQMGLLANTAQKINEIHAPMPGLIIEIIAQEGQEIKEGDQLFILSAMKMENIILAPGDGTVKEIRVSTNDAVEKGQLIIEME
ncbi:biotin/lipoyl-containing protein [Spongiimicrobium salis]|uniref:biotin/lipoyl-containing protein n=1 Tax=Spongiimicrobium salis TaxID=1667022 RepID=UPI00374CF4D5